MMCMPTYGSGGTFYGTQVICCYLLPPKKAPSVLRNTYTPPRGNDNELIPMYLVVQVLKADPTVIPNHSVRSLNMERIIMRLNHE